MGPLNVEAFKGKSFVFLRDLDFRAKRSLGLLRVDIVGNKKKRQLVTEDYKQ